MTSIFLQLRKSQNVLNFCSHLFENQLRYMFISLKVSALLPSNREKQSMNDVRLSGAKFAYIGKNMRA